VLAEVYASRATGQGHIQAVIHQDSRAGASAFDLQQGFRDQPSPFFSGVILFAELNPIDAGGGGIAYAVQEQAVRIPGSGKGQASAVGDVAKNRLLWLRRGAHD